MAFLDPEIIEMVRIIDPDIKEMMFFGPFDILPPKKFLLQKIFEF